ncbi:hypothetical protein K469DRAFT_232112 [Zopfia rhizophila CBS 207.26]|uniref:BED-type domain-containing protein n=1 Tax=Zopfia rhizophila CBS 207.26 TaxID=1314779 RepID=A0A6A6DVY4_9PEZI|nr:hypothetical protein K469DRAFT_232112 [Zopfia rhizophila CBS 207.26]
MAESFSDSSSELSELDSDQFSIRSDDSPISTPSIRAQTKRRKLRATSTWSYSCLHKSNEPERNHQKRKIFYCKFDGCSFVNAITTNIRAHLKVKHGIIVAEEESLVTQAQRNH